MMGNPIDKSAAKAECAQWSKLIEDIFDNRLMYFTARRERIERFFSVAEKKYHRVHDLIDSITWNKTLGLFIYNKLFGKDGRIGEYLDKDLIPNLSLSERSFLSFMRQNPCEFCFVTLKEDLGQDFYVFENVFSAVKYTIYSKGVSATLKDRQPLTWLMNLTFTGQCHQTMGPIIGLEFDSDDLFTFGVHCNPDIVNELDLIDFLQSNPFPFQMLAAFPNFPRLVGKNREMFYLYGEYEAKFSPDDFNNEFYISKKGKYYRLVPKGEYAFHPHFGVAWYDSVSNILQVESTTEIGFLEQMRQLKRVIEDQDYHYQLKSSYFTFSMLQSTVLNGYSLISYKNLFDNVPTGNEHEQELYIKKFNPEDYPGINLDFLNDLGEDGDEEFEDEEFDDENFDDDDFDEADREVNEDQEKADALIMLFGVMQSHLDVKGKIDSKKIAKDFDLDLEYVEIVKDTFLKFRSTQN